MKRTKFSVRGATTQTLHLPLMAANVLQGDLPTPAFRCDHCVPSLECRLRRQLGMTAAFIAGATLGLLNLPHCAGMCGPLVGASCGQRGAASPLRYQLGRTLSYVGAGAIAGHIGEGLASLAPGRAAGFVFAGLSAIACLLTARSILGRPKLITLKKSPRRAGLATLMRLVPSDPSVHGFLSVLLPCGLLAAALLAATATGLAREGALLMFGFVCSSAIALLGAGWLIQFVPGRASISVRRGFAALLVVTAALAIARPLRSEFGANASDRSTTHHCH